MNDTTAYDRRLWALVPVVTALVVGVGAGGCKGGSIKGVVFKGAVDAPTVNAPPNRTAEVSIGLSGNKAADTFVWLQTARDADARQVSAEATRLGWAASLDLVEGENQFVVFASDPEVTKFSVRVGPFTVVRDTTPPATPIVDVPTSPTDAAQVTLTGTRAADGNLCLRVGQAPVCTEVAALDGSTTFSITEDLANGFNTFCLSSADDLGNSSPEACVDVVRIPGPDITFVVPGEGATVRGTSVTVVVEVVGGDGDLAVDTVQICFDGSGCQNAVPAGGKYQATLSLGSLTDGSTHTIEATATNLADVSTTASITIVFSTGAIGVLSNDPAAASSQDATTVVDADGKVHLFWADACMQQTACGFYTGTASDTRPFDIFHRRYELGTWTTTRIISTDVADDDSQQPTAVLDAGDNIHIAWSDTGTIAAGDNDVAPDIVVRVMQPDGTLGETVAVGHSDGTDTAPHLAAAPDGTVVLVWQRVPVEGNDDPEVYFARWTPVSAGATTGSWSTPKLVSDHANDGRSVNPRVVADSDSVAWIIWQDDGDMDGADPDDDIYLRSVTGSATLGTQVLVTTYGPESTSRNPEALVDPSDVIHIVWVDDNASSSSGSDNDIWYVTYDTGATSFGTRRVVSETTNASDTPSIGRAADGTFAIAWADRISTQSDVYYRALAAGLFGPVVLLSNDTDELSLAPSVSIDGAGDLHVVWQDDSEIIPADTGQGDSDIFWKLLPATDDWGAVQ